MKRPLLSQWLHSVGDLFVMKACLHCSRALVSQEKYLCIQCLDGLEPTNYHLQPADNEMYRRLAGKVPLRGAIGMSHFDKKGILQALIQALKYDQKPELGVWLGSKYARELAPAGIMEQFDALIPVPLHPRKQRQRKYNQAEKIAQGMSLVCGRPVLTELLKRTQFTKSQTKVSGHQRYDNVSEAFSCVASLPARIMLIDDVMTTGATLEACIRAMIASERGPQEIWVLSIGVARG